MLTRIQHLRYRVYCEEMGYLPPENFSIPLEVDAYDAKSTSFYAVSHADELIGTARFINPIEGPIHAAQYCALYPEVVLPHWTVIGEISRLILPPAIRRSPQRSDFVVGSLQPHSSKVAGPLYAAPTSELLGAEHGASSFILLGLFRAVYHHSVQSQVTHWLAGMNPQLARLIRKMGFSFTRIGPTNEAEGIALYVAELSVLGIELSRRNPALFTWFNRHAA